jgi:hypothetical protein
MRQGQAVFVDTGAWLALALVRDPLHDRAKLAWDELGSSGARLHTSVPVVLETFTFLDRNAMRDVALAWKDSVEGLKRLTVLECTRSDVDRAWSWFKRKDLHKLSAVDATSFVLMARARIKIAFAFDHHFATAGFRLIG